ncbi:hypothetical protein J6590_065216 [Homalodisca vitripennis]|nr:hypothetical protein J6590_065216 [Homalodisca vitripennis]
MINSFCYRNVSLLLYHSHIQFAKQTFWYGFTKSYSSNYNLLHVNFLCNMCYFIRGKNLTNSKMNLETHLCCILTHYHGQTEYVLVDVIGSVVNNERVIINVIGCNFSILFMDMKITIGLRMEISLVYQILLKKKKKKKTFTTINVMQSLITCMRPVQKVSDLLSSHLNDKVLAAKLSGHVEGTVMCMHALFPIMAKLQSPAVSL